MLNIISYLGSSLWTVSVDVATRSGFSLLKFPLFISFSWCAFNRIFFLPRLRNVNIHFRMIIGRKYLKKQRTSLVSCYRSVLNSAPLLSKCSIIPGYSRRGHLTRPYRPQEYWTGRYRGVAYMSSTQWTCHQYITNLTRHTYTPPWYQMDYLKTLYPPKMIHTGWPLPSTYPLVLLFDDLSCWWLFTLPPDDFLPT